MDEESINLAVAEAESSGLSGDAIKDVMDDGSDSSDIPAIEKDEEVKESGIEASFNPFASQLAPDYKEQWQWQVRVITQSYFRGYFGKSKYNRWGYYIEKQMCPSISHYSYWIHYTSDDATLYNHDDDVAVLAMSEDGRYVFTGAWDKVIICYDMITLDIIKQWTVDRPFRAMAYKCGLLAVSSGAEIILYDGHTLVQKKELTGHTKKVLSLCFNDSGDSILSAGSDSTIRMWSVDSGKCVRVFTGHSDECRSAVFLGDSTLKVWNKDSGKCMKDVTDGINDWVNFVVFNCDETLVGCRVINNRVVVFNTDDYSRVYSKEGEFNSIIFHPFQPDILLVSDTASNSISIININTDDILHKMDGHKAYVNRMCFTPDASRLISVSDDRTVMIWNIWSKI